MKLLDKLKSLFGARSQPQESAYAAVIVRGRAECCDAARATANHPILLTDTPMLPLPGCTMPGRCVCRLRERPDRRVGERRFEKPIKSADDTIASVLRDATDRRK